MPKHNYDDEIISYYINPKREIQINTYNGDYSLDNTLYDLIQARISGKGGIAWI